MTKLKIFVALALLAVAMPLSAQRQYAEGASCRIRSILTSNAR